MSSASAWASSWTTPGASPARQPGGWANEPAITGVTGAGKYPLGAVSGYQFPTVTGTFAYSGVAKTRGIWCAVTATFVCMAHQTGWGGYVDYGSAPYTGISATFTVPALSGESGALCSIWVGLGNVKQVGIYCGYAAGAAGNAACNPWTWFLPAGELWKSTAYPVSAGDALTLSLAVAGSYWNASIANATAGWSYTQVKSIQAANIGNSFPFPLTSAEVIVEKAGSSALPDFGAITFTGITATPPVSMAPQPLAIVNTQIDAVPGPFSNGSFTLTWKAYR